MSYKSPYDTFYFESYRYIESQSRAVFTYSFDRTRRFEEVLHFNAPARSFNREVLDRALQLAHVLLGVSYYKTFPTKQVGVESFKLTDDQANFFSTAYRDGLSQFVYENNLQPDNIASFTGDSQPAEPLDYKGEGLVALQSGGKDSLLLAELLKSNEHEFTSLYVKTGQAHPAVIDKIGAAEHRNVRREIDLPALRLAATEGGLNGHVPITYLVIGMALIDMVLNGGSKLLLGVGQEGEEPYLMQGDYAIRHQWSKTYAAELLISDYVSSHVASNLAVGSPLRGFSELRVAELFAEKCWQSYGRGFSSCNVANYRQGQSSEELLWCSKCAKCANSFLLFAPFVEPRELIKVFGANLFKDPSLTDTFKGLLGVDGAVKPFECVGETEELRLAYHMAVERHPAAEYELQFAVPESRFDYQSPRPLQSWAQIV